MTADRLSIAVLWLLAFISGLFIVNAWQLELFGVSFVLLLLWAVVLLCGRLKDGIAIPKSPILTLAGLFWLLVLCSVLWSGVPFISVLGFCLFSALPLTFFLFVIQKNENLFYSIAKILIVVFSGLAIWAMIQYFFYADYFNGQARHPLANPGSLAALLSLALVSALGWMLTAPSKTQSNIALGFSLLMIGGMIATGNRGAIFALIPALLIFGLVVPAFVRRHWRCLLIVLIGSGLLLALSIWGGGVNGGSAARLAGAFAPADQVPAMGRFSNRAFIWETALGVIKDHWLLGTGIGTFFLYYQQYRVPEDVHGAFMAHSDPLQFWAELGILGPLLFYAFLIAALLQTIRAMRGLASDDPRRVYIMAPFCALGAMIVHTHITFNFYNLSILYIGGFLLAWWFLQTTRGEDLKYTALSFPPAMPILARGALLALPFILLAGLFAALIASEHLVNKGRDKAFAGDIESFSTYLNKAHRVGLESNYRAYLLAASIPMGILETKQDILPRDEIKNTYAQVMYFLDRADALNPRSPATPYYRAKVQQYVPPDMLRPQSEAPEVLYQKALKLDPLHVGARLGLMDIYQARGDLDQALAVADAGLRWPYNNEGARDFYLRAALLYLQGEKPDRHKEVMDILKNFRDRISRQRKKVITSPIEGIFTRGETLTP